MRNVISTPGQPQECDLQHVTPGIYKNEALHFTTPNNYMLGSDTDITIFFRIFRTLIWRYLENLEIFRKKMAVLRYF